MQFRPFTFLTAAILFAGSMIPVRLAAQNTNSGIVTFDAPGAGTTSNFGTFPRSINDSGAVTGHYTDANRVNHGFLRTPHGNIITFNIPGAGTAAGSGFGTFPESINDAGTITGHYTDAENVWHGFLRTPRGDIITFDAPSGHTAANSLSGTFPDSINDAGTITGYFGGTPMSHGFIRTVGGRFITFDVPGASSLPGDGTFPRAINRRGAIVGNYSDASKEVNGGFLRSPGGTFTTFQAPGADTTEGSGNGTFPVSINDAGAITGRYVDGNIVYHGFVRSPGGEFIAFDAPGASSALDDGTFPLSINDKGAIVGNYSAADKEASRGFLRNP